MKIIQSHYYLLRIHYSYTKEFRENSVTSNLGLRRYGDDVNSVGNADQSSYARVPK